MFAPSSGPCCIIIMIMNYKKSVGHVVKCPFRPFPSACCVDRLIFRFVQQPTTTTTRRQSSIIIRAKCLRQRQPSTLSCMSAVVSICPSRLQHSFFELGSSPWRAWRSRREDSADATVCFNKAEHSGHTLELYSTRLEMRALPMHSSKGDDAILPLEAREIVLRLERSRLLVNTAKTDSSEYSE